MGVDNFDYVIVGAGAAGSVLANRLSEDPSITVCLLEAGPPDRNPWIHIPAGFTKTLFNPAVTWQFRTEPTANTAGRAIATTQGRTLGGSSSVNGMIYNRGQPDDLNSWAQRGNRGWGYDDVLPYYRRSENRIGAGDDHKRGRNQDGIPITDNDWTHPLTEAFIAGAVGLGIPRNPDYNSGDQAGVGYYQRAIRNGRRVSAARAFLGPAKSRKNLDIRTDARASAVVFEGTRAIGVRYQSSRLAAPVEIRARREVILSAGTVNTARLLQVSGVGPREWLTELGIDVLLDAPVGRHFRDHFAVRNVVRVKPGTPTMNEMARGPRLAVELARWATGRPSILAIAPSVVHVFWKSDESLDAPDLQCVFTPGSYKAGRNYILDDYPGMTAGAWPHRPESTGFVRARARDVWEDPVIQPNYLSHEQDRRVTLGGMRLVRRMLATPELAPFVDREILPGPDVNSDAEMLDFARANGGTTYHLIGTCRMGPSTDPSAVVDDRLRLHGLQALRVVDASIMPSMPSANTYATTLMIAEKAADMIKQDRTT